jgi:hypothetical protein
VVGIERREKERKRNEKDKNSGTHFWRGFVGPPPKMQVWRGNLEGYAKCKPI